MLNNEPDDEESILLEIQVIEKELKSFSGEIYDISMKRKFLRHRLADLKYKLTQISDGINDGV